LVWLLLICLIAIIQKIRFPYFLRYHFTVFLYQNQVGNSLKKSVFVVLIIFCCFGLECRSQNPSNRNYMIIVIDADTLVLDSVSLVAGSVELKGIDSQDYAIDYMNAWIVVKNPNLRGKTIEAVYRKYPYRLNQIAVNKPVSLIEKQLYEPVNPFSITESASPMDALFSGSDLTTYGSISRGISVGNAQDMVVNSNLNLQLSGKLDEDIEITASITDQNIPIQPEGNTRQLKEFDKVFILLKYKNKASLRAGDIESQSPENTYFMRFNKQGQGLQGNILFDEILKNGDTAFYKVGASASLAKGTFNRQTILPINQVQGPYKLQGVNGETFIIVLAGSERIYINSVLLTRGEDADYVMNYNTGEITFTSRRMITNDLRIVAEFEYSDRNYPRAVVHLNTEALWKKAALRFNFFNEQDLKNQPNEMNLTDASRNFLASLGNDLQNAYMQNIDSVAFNSNEVLYKMTDTLVNGIYYDSVFVYSTHKDSACYRLGFLLVGQGNGDYILMQTTLNGRVYQWVAPVNGIAQGDYAPVRLLITPKRTQMYSLALDYKPFKTTIFSVEGSISNNDLNTFSTIGNAHNIGFGLKTSLSHTSNLQKKNSLKLPSWQARIQAVYETKNKNFRYIENYRNVSFSRDYNLTDTMLLQNEHLTSIQIAFIEQQKGAIDYNFNTYLIPYCNYLALSNQLKSNFSVNGYKMRFDARLLNSKQKDYKTMFLQSNELFSKSLRKIEIGVSNEMELNLYRDRFSDSLMGQSFAYNEASFFIKNNDSTASAYRYGLSYSNRIEGMAKADVLSANALAHKVSANFDFLKYINHPLRFNAAYRYLHHNDSIGENTILSSVDYQGRFWKGAVQVGIFYEIGSGMEQKNQYSYLRVTDGQGVYQWIDYNGNGIEELEEFETAVYKDQANYIRVWLPSNDYIKTFNNQLTQSLNIRPVNVWRDVQGFRKFLARFANLTTYRTQTKNTLANGLNRLNPFAANIEDTSLVSNTGNFRNALSFNQISTIWGIDAIYNDNWDKTLNVNGFALSKNKSWLFSGRYGFYKYFTLKSEYQNGLSRRSSEFLANKNYQIHYNGIEGSFIFQYNQLKITTLYNYTQKINQEGEEKSFHNKASLECNYSMPKRGSILLKMSYFHILFRGETNSAVGYDMLESLNAGNNGLITIVYQTTLLQNLQLNLSYEGRIAEQSKMRHTAMVELRAYF
jgi:hypothetical protein